MNFDPFEFYGGNDDFFGYGYGNDYGGNFAGNMMQSFYWILGLVIAAVVIALILNFTFLRRKNEGRFSGFAGRLYNFFNLNRFYSEGIIKFLSVMTFMILTFLGIYMMCTGGLISGLAVITLGNLAARLSYELLMMFVIFCKKSVSMDKKLSAISKFYDDMEDWDYHDASDEGMAEETVRDEAVAEMPDRFEEVNAFEHSYNDHPEDIISPEPVTDEEYSEVNNEEAEEADQSVDKETSEDIPSVIHMPGPVAEED